MKISQIIFSFIFLGFVMLYIIISRSFISGLTVSESTKTEFMSNPINIVDTGVTEIKIDNQNWSNKKELENHLLLTSLVFKYNDTFPTERYYDSKLIIEINAFSNYNKDTIINRLVPINYASTNKIILKNSGQNNGSSIDSYYNRGYPLGLINNFHFSDPNINDRWDDIIIKLNIIQGDSILNKLTPRLLIQEYKSHSDDGFSNSITKLFIDIILVLCAIFLLILFLTYIKYDKQ